MTALTARPRCGAVPAPPPQVSATAFKNRLFILYAYSSPRQWRKARASGSGSGRRCRGQVAGSQVSVAPSMSAAPPLAAALWPTTPSAHHRGRTGCGRSRRAFTCRQLERAAPSCEEKRGLVGFQFILCSATPQKILPSQFLPRRKASAGYVVVVVADSSSTLLLLSPAVVGRDILRLIILQQLQQLQQLVVVRGGGGCCRQEEE